MKGDLDTGTGGRSSEGLGSTFRPPAGAAPSLQQPGGKEASVQVCVPCLSLAVCHSKPSTGTETGCWGGGDGDDRGLAPPLTLKSPSATVRVR